MMRGRTSALVSILASSATRCRFVDRFVRLKVLSRVSRQRFSPNGTPLSSIGSRSVRFPDVTGTIEVLRLPATHIRLLICFASGVRAILLASCFATCAPGRSEGPSGPGSLFNRRPDLPVCSHADVSGISQVSRQSIPCLCPALATPAEPTIPRLLDGFVDAVPALPTAKTSALNEFRGSITRLWHLLPTLQDWCRHHPCKARFRLAGSPLPGGSRTLWIATKGFRSQSHPPFLDLSWRKGSFILNLPSHHSITLSARSRKLSGIVSPISFAVLRLIASVNLVGCSTGKSAGLAPLRMRSI